MRDGVTHIGPADQGRRMTLAEFGPAIGREGCRYELSRGVVTVFDIPGLRHLTQLDALRAQLDRYDFSHPRQIHAIAGSGDCKIPVAAYESERHPDLALYKAPPAAEGRDVWERWVPELVAEIVAPDTRRHDYEEKPDEYFRFGVGEYWIIDEAADRMLALCRREDRWAEHVVRPGETYYTPLLPALGFDLRPIFQAARRRLTKVREGPTSAPG